MICCNFISGKNHFDLFIFPKNNVKNKPTFNLELESRLKKCQINL
jgi:hypothetical protein